MKGSEPKISKIAYQNKDILSKIFAEQMKDKSLQVYGIHLPKIVDVLPTNLPIVEANELRLDNLFLLEDKSIAIIDYESAYDSENKIKYLNYIIRVLKKYVKEGMQNITLHMIVIYTADVEPRQTQATFDAGCITLTVEEAFLSQLPSDVIRRNLETKVNNEISLTKDELMQFIILPLSYKGKERKKEIIKEAVELAKGIHDEQVKKFILSGILVFSDKLVDEDIAREVRRELTMLKVEKIIFDEGYEKGTEQTKRKIISQMLFNGLSCEEIAKYTSETIEEIMNIRASLN